MVDVIVTTLGGSQTADAVLEGGGLVGTRSNREPPDGVPIEFVDWPFMDEDVTVEEHIEYVARLNPRYAVAPDVTGDRSLEAVLDVGDELRRHADVVIVVPKSVPADRVPRRFRLGVPFRDNFQTDTGVNTFLDFGGRPVHILGGNPTDQFGLADEFGLDVRSVDSPTPLAWADFGRVWLGRTRSADEVIGLLDEHDVDPVALEGLGITDRLLLETSRTARITFSVRNLVNAWNDPQRRVRLPVRVEPGRGPPPPMDEPVETFGETLSIEEQRERFREGTMEIEVGRADPDVPSTVRTTFESFGERATAAGEEGEGMVDDRKRRRFERLQERSDAAVDELGLGPGELPNGDEDDDEE